MPYVPASERGKAYNEPMVDSQLAYFIYKHCVDYLGTEYRWKDLKDVIGVLDCVKFEIQRRYIAPYEDKAIERNGDIKPGLDL